MKGDMFFEMTTNKSSLASAKYAKANIIKVSLKLNRKTDADLIDLLEDVENKQGFVKELIRNKMAAKATEQEAPHV